MSEKSVPWAFHEHFSFFVETYSLNGAESKKKLSAIFSKQFRHVLCKLDMTSLSKNCFHFVSGFVELDKIHIKNAVKTHFDCIKDKKANSFNSEILIIYFRQ